MKQYLAQHKIDPRDALHICGAIHSVSDVEEYGSANPNVWDIPPRTNTVWLYGLIPSSYTAIDWQFNFPAGTVTLADAAWDKSQRGLNIQSFTLAKTAAPRGKGKEKKSPAKPAATVALAPPAENGDTLLNYLTRAPQLASEDEEQLLAWCVGVTDLARKNGYLASTADSIAVYHTSLLLAQLRNR